MQKYFSGSNPTLPPNPVILEFTPRNDLNSFGKHSLNFHLLNWVCGQRGFDHPTDQKVLLFGHGLDSGPFDQLHRYKHHQSGVHQIYQSAHMS
jgi:hypothetical protein